MQPGVAAAVYRHTYATDPRASHPHLHVSSSQFARTVDPLCDLRVANKETNAYDHASCVLEVLRDDKICLGFQEACHDVSITHGLTSSSSLYYII